MKEIRIEARVRNNILWHAIFDKWSSVAAFCREKEFCPCAVGALLNLKKAPLKRNGKYLLICEQLAAALVFLVEDLFPLELYGLKGTKAVAEVSFSELPDGGQRIKLLPATETPFNDVVRRDIENALQKALAELTSREEKVLRMRFGLGVLVEHTLEEVGAKFGMTREYIHVLEARALRKLCHPGRSSSRRLRFVFGEI